MACVVVSLDPVSCHVSLPVAELFMLAAGDGAAGLEGVRVGEGVAGRTKGLGVRILGVMRT